MRGGEGGRGGSEMSVECEERGVGGEGMKAVNETQRLHERREVSLSSCLRVCMVCGGVGWKRGRE